MTDEIQVRKHSVLAGVWEILFNRPERRNALTFQMWQQLEDAIRSLSADDRVRMIVIQGASDVAFAAGADISEFPKIRRDRKTAMLYQAATDGATRALYDARPITIAMIQGACYGGGTQIASACDIRIADDSARFAITPVKMGFVYGHFETSLLVRLFGETRAMDLLLSGRELSAKEAYQMGFLTHLFPREQFSSLAQEVLSLLQVGSADAQVGMKQMIHQIGEGSPETGLTRAMVAASFDGADYQEGYTAFLEKRRPRFPSARRDD